MLLGEVIAVLSWKVGEFYTKYFMSLLQAAKLSTVTLEQPVLIQIILYTPSIWVISNCGPVHYLLQLMYHHLNEMTIPMGSPYNWDI